MNFVVKRIVRRLHGLMFSINISVLHFFCYAPFTHLVIGTRMKYAYMNMYQR